MKYLKIIGLLALTIYLFNASWLRSMPQGELRFIAHRGVHQTFPKADLSSDGCTATRMDSPQHSYLENTLDSIKQAFSYGADTVEIDIHPTVDGRFAVFHDWTIDCRTEGQGITRDQTLAYLQTLDIGYGYTADGGETYPFRGKGVGKLPSLAQVLDTFPEHSFLINIKSNDPNEADLIARFLAERPGEDLQRLSFYGGSLPVKRLLSLNSQLTGFLGDDVKQCVARYALLGWTSYVPAICRNTTIAIPAKYAPYLWGWPRLFMRRMETVETDVILLNLSHGHTDGIDDAAQIEALIPDFTGFIWTDKIEQVGHLGRAGQTQQ